MAIWLSFWDLGLALFLAVWFSDFSITPHGSLWKEPVIFVVSLFPDVLKLLMLFLLICFTVVLNYYVIALFVNETFVDVDANSITIFHRPLPFWRNKKIPLQSIEHLSITRFSSRGQVTYNIRSAITGKRNVKLLSINNNYEQAKFIKDEIEDYLVSGRGSPPINASR